jgi:hypothetical protein
MKLEFEAHEGGFAEELYEALRLVRAEDELVELFDGDHYDGFFALTGD